MIQNRIKVLRAEHDWTQADLAEKVGISRQAVISIEKYKYTPSLEYVYEENGEIQAFIGLIESFVAGLFVSSDF